jgi:hypothetical protein
MSHAEQDYFDEGAAMKAAGGEKRHSADSEGIRAIWP